MINHLEPPKSLVRKVCRRLIQEYPNSRLGNKKNPLDEYLYITLSRRTRKEGLLATYKAFKKRYPSWHAVYGVSVTEIQKVISSGGLARQKATNIKMAVRCIYERFGEVSLRSLRKLKQEEVEVFLLSLPGVGLKSARCIMMYSLGYAVLPIDTHVARISYRLGWVTGVNSRMLHDRLERLVPPELRYSFHVCCIQHGQSVCRGRYPKCDSCCLSSLCQMVGLSNRS